MESENELRQLYGFAEMLFLADNPSQQFSAYASGGHCFDRYWKLARATVAYIQNLLQPL